MRGFTDHFSGESANPKIARQRDSLPSKRYSLENGKEVNISNLGYFTSACYVILIKFTHYDGQMLYKFGEIELLIDPVVT